MAMRRAALAAVGAAAILSTVQAAQQAEPTAVERAVVRRTARPLAALGRYPREERFVRDIYARLMRYDYAAKELRKAEQRTAGQPSDYLVVSVHDVRTAEASAGAPPALSAPSERLAITRQEVCAGEDPCHASYDVSWNDGTVVTSRVAAQPLPSGISRYSRYKVTISLDSIVRTYDALVVYSDQRDGLTAIPTIVDPVIPDLNAFAGDHAPLVRPQWRDYVRTRQYAAVARSARIWKSLRATGIVPDVPVGYLPGDEVTSGEEVPMPIVAESCEAPSVSQSPNVLKLSTGDTGQITVTVTPNDSVTRSFSSSLSSNPNSSCNASLTIPAVTGAGQTNHSVNAAPAGCSGVFSARASAGGSQSSNDTTVEVPPQILIRMIHGEARGESDQAQLGVGIVVRNRFGNPDFSGSTTYQNTITCQQFNGTCGNAGLTNGPQPQLDHSAEVFTGRAQDYTGGAGCFFSPISEANKTAIQNAANSGTTTIPSVTTDPGCYQVSIRQFYLVPNVYPGFVFVRKRNASEAAVVGMTFAGSSATFYEHINFDIQLFQTSVDMVYVGDGWNDRISSVRVPAGRTVILYEHSNWTGASLTLTSDTADLRNFPGPGPGGTWNDVVSSLRIQ